MESKAIEEKNSKKIELEELQEEISKELKKIQQIQKQLLKLTKQTKQNKEQLQKLGNVEHENVQFKNDIQHIIVEGNNDNIFSNIEREKKSQMK